MATKMSLKKLKALRESLDQTKTSWCYDKGIQDPLTKELIKASKAAAKMKRLHSKLGKRFRKKI